MNVQELKEVIGGVIVLMMTPYDHQFNIDVSSLRKEVNFLLDNGLKEGNGVLVPLGSAGEFPMLTVQERKKILEVILEEVKGKIPVVPGCCHTNTKVVVELLKHAESVGAAGAMVSPPYYYPGLNEEAICKFFEEISKVTELGIIVYNNYFATQFDIPLETLEKLSQIDNIIGFKETNRDFSKIHLITEGVGDKITILNGTGERNEPYASFLGTKGFFTSLANFAPKLSLQMWHFVNEKKYDEAKKLHSQLAPLFNLAWFNADALQGQSYIKEAMRMMGIISTSLVRPPLLPIKEEKRQKLREELENLGLL